MVKYKKTRKKKKGNLKPKEKILKYLIENKEPKTILQLSGAVAIDYKNTYNHIGDLSASGAIVQKVFGNAHPIEINLSPNQEIFNVEEKRTEEFVSKNPKLRLIKQDIEEVNYPFMIVLLFGSYVKGTSTKSSDIDICIILDNKEKSKKLFEKLSLFSTKLEIHEFTTEEFVLMIEKQQRNLGHEIIKNNIILYGVENYYNLISKWMKKE
jgi:predicted nucleotidyltransferase